MPRLHLDHFNNSGGRTEVSLPDSLVAEMRRLADSVVAPSAGAQADLAIHPVMVFDAPTEAAAYSAAGAWCRDHLGEVFAVIASWMRFVDEDATYQLGLVLEA